MVQNNVAAKVLTAWKVFNNRAKKRKENIFLWYLSNRWKILAIWRKLKKMDWDRRPEEKIKNNIIRNS